MRGFSRFRSIVGWPSLVGCIVAAVVLFPWEVAPTGAETPRAAARVTASREHPLRVLLVGDSLADASIDFFTEALTSSGDAVVDTTMVRGGSAICDWLPFLASKLQAFDADVAVVEFAGNRLTPCMSDPATGVALAGDAWLDKYRKDATIAMSMFDTQHVDVFWIGTPTNRDDPGAQAHLNGVYRRLAVGSSSTYANAGAAVLDHGRYTDYLPCKADEPCTDTDPSTGQPAAKVRAPDGGHFCPNASPAFAGVTEPCTVWSSGAWRFGSAMADPVIDAYGL